jgi:penicillin-binding protein 2
VHCGGGANFYGRYFKCWKKGGHGTVDLRGAIAQSCDVYFYELSSMMGVEKLSGWLAHFGLGARTGIDIGGELKGINPNPEWKKAYFRKPGDQVWFPGETVSFGIGQGYLILTPLQSAHMASIMASRGKSYQPRLVTAFREQGTGKIEHVKPVLLETVEASAENWTVAINGMIKVMMPGGTGVASQRGAEYQIAGKTGTAQVFTVGQNQNYKLMEAQLHERLLDHGWFIAFAPAENPKIAVAVLIENGKHGTAASPIARRVLDQFLLGHTTTPEIVPPVIKSDGTADPPAAAGDE